VKLCQNGRAKVSARSALPAITTASGIELGYAIDQIMKICKGGGGSVSAHFDAATGNDYILHIHDTWV
jgi:hypothetical protein